MAEGLDGFMLSAEFRTAGLTVDHQIVAACFCAGRLDSVFFHSFCRLMAESGYIYGLGLDRKRRILERPTGIGNSSCRFAGRIDHRFGRLNRFGLDMAFVVFTDPRRRNALVVVSPGVGDIAPVVADSRLARIHLGLSFEGRIVKRCTGVGNIPVFRAGGMGHDRRCGSRFMLRMRRVALADS